MYTAKVNDENGVLALKSECIGELYKNVSKPTIQKNLVGKVIGSFPFSLNIKTPRNELLVISLNKIQSPITINLKPKFRDCNFTGLVDYGYDVFRFQDSVYIGERVKFHTAKSVVFKNCLAKPKFYGLNKFGDSVEKIISTLMELGKSGCLLEPDITNYGAFRQFVAETLENNVRNKDNTKFVRTLSHSLLKMCGRGPGFTPSGDDFICGFSSLFNWLSQGLNCPCISLPMERIYILTTWISFKFIEYYQKLIVDEQIQG